MTSPFATVAGFPATAITVHVPRAGVWFADVDFEGEPDVSGGVKIALGQLELSGTIDARFAGTHGLRRRARIAGGAGGWATLLNPKAYHNDSQVRARTIVEDAAREAGETLGTFEPEAERVGIDYVREAGPASRVLEDVIGAVDWWVDFDGKTYVGERVESTPEAGSYEVLDYDPRARIVTLALNDPRAVQIGSALSERLDEPQVVRALEIEVTSEALRAKAWCGDHGDLAVLLRSIARRATGRKLFGLWRYRVVKMSSERVELQAVRRDADLPDVLPISMWPGVAGAHAELAASSEVLVQFVEGDRTKPVITHFAGKAGPGWTPTTITFDAQQIKLGQDASEFVALANLVKQRLDTLQNAIDTHTHIAGTLASPSGAVTGASGVLASPVGALEGVAATKVKAK